MVQVLFLGFLLGMRHALDADHVVAVSTLVSRGRSLWKAAAAGAAWGIGHTLTLALAGVITMMLKVSVPERLAASLEFMVGVVLVVLGFSTFRACREGRLRHHEHHFGPGLRPLLVGMVHGLAGSGALLVLVLSTVRSVSTGLLFILLFGIGSTLGMIVVGTALAAPLALSAGRFPAFERRLAMAAGAVSVALGVVMMTQTIVGVYKI